MKKLPMDLSKFKKIKSDAKTSTFQHKDGHTLTIAHKGLSGALKGQLDKLPLVKSSSPQNFAEGGETKYPWQQDEQAPAATPDNSSFSLSNMGDTLSPFQSAQAADTSNSALPDTSGLQISNNRVNLSGDNQKTDPYGPSRLPDSSPIEPTQSIAEPLPQSTFSGPATTNPPQSPDPYGLQQSYQQQLGGIKKVGAGQQLEAQAQGQLGQANLVQEQEAQKAQQNSIQAYQDAQAPIIAERQSLMKDIQSGHIDPKHYVDNMTTGGKLSSAIGLILGGMGAGLTHGPNLAFQYLQKQIDSDVDAQKADLGKKQNLLAHNFQQTQDLRSAYDLTRLQTNDMLASHLRMEADKSADPMAKARALQSAGMLDNQAAQITHEMAINKMQQAALGGQGQGGINPVMAIKMLAPPAQQEALMKDLKAKNDMESNIKNMMGAFDYVAQNNTVMNKANPQAQSRIDSEWDPKMVKLAHESAGRFNLEELPIMNKYKPKATDDQQTIAQKRQAFQNDMASRASFPSLEPYGVRAGQPPAQAGNFGFKPRGK